MKKTFFQFLLPAIVAATLLGACKKQDSNQETPGASTANMLTDAEKSAGWELLFDGSTFNGWKRYNHDTIGPLWTIQQGEIVCDGTGFGEGSGEHGGSLMTTRTFGNFELSIEWKITAGGNSGILYHVVESPEYHNDYETGPEFQVMDDSGWKGELTPAQKAGSNYDMFEAPTTKKLMPVGEWNTSKIIYNNGHVEHWLNGEKTVEFEEGSEEYNQRYQKSKWVGYPAWNKSKTGAISLQDHGAPVYYRSIKIKPL
ncbi:MAG: DUF1080 domain-containing protein [Cyclobacteriaceae bacterium]|nr:DUF1080 domain-containing protein [Cyclobacteriaceae bacterium]